jgi:hypothetical protein
MNTQNYTDFVKALWKSPEQIIVQNTTPERVFVTDLTHAVIGLMSEFAELLSATLEPEEAQITCLEEEGGDLIFYWTITEVLLENYVPRGLSRYQDISKYSLRNLYEIKTGAKFEDSDAEFNTGMVIGSMAGLVKKLFANGKSLTDEINGFPIADLLCVNHICLRYEIENIIQDLGLGSWETLAEKNQAKLSKRYPKGTYTDADANSRKDKAENSSEI